MKKIETMRQGLTTLQTSLKEVPFVEEVLLLPQRPGPHPPDACLKVHLPDGPLTLFVEIRPNGQPRSARTAINRLLEFMLVEPGTYGVLVAPYLSPAVVQICAEAGIGCLDLAGNCRLSFRQVYIHQRCCPNPYRQHRELASLYSPAAERILRVLLAQPFRPWKTLPLAEAAQVSPGMVTRVKKLLAGEEWVRSTAQGFALTQPDALLRDWAAQRRPQRNPARSYHTPDPEGTLSALAQACASQALVWALTGASAAARLLQQPVPARESAYIQGDAARLAQTLGLQPAAAQDAGLVVYEVRDAGVLLEGSIHGGWPMVSAVQTYLDLQHLPNPLPHLSAVVYEELLAGPWARLARPETPSSP